MAGPGRIRHVHTTGLAAQHRLALVDLNLESTLRQFMRRAETRNPSAENGNGLLHFVNYYTASGR
jgi:hypothetical protein